MNTMIQKNSQPSFHGLFKIHDKRITQFGEDFSKTLSDKVEKICYDEFASKITTPDGYFIVSDKSRDANIFSKMLEEGIDFLFRNIGLEDINFYHPEKLTSYFEGIKPKVSKIALDIEEFKKYWQN